MNLKVSCIIPAYNEENYIVNCLESVLNQEEVFFDEVIVVNNNSTDLTKKVAQGFNVKVIDEKTPGVSAARNEGASVSNSEIIYFLDADCQVPQNQAKKIKNFFQKHPTISAISGPVVYLDGGKFIEFLTDNLNIFAWYFKLLKIVFSHEGLCGGNMVVSRESFQGINGFDETLDDVEKSAEDLDFSLRLDESGYKARYLISFRVISSFRRNKRAPLRTAFYRIKAFLYLVWKYKIKRVIPGHSRVTF